MSSNPSSRFDPRELALPGLVLALWWAATHFGLADTRIVAPPADVLAVALHDVASGELLDGLLGFYQENPLPGARGLLLLMGGAVNRVAADATAYPHRAAMHNVDVGGDSASREMADKYVDWGRRYWKVVDPFTGGGFYINAASADDDERRVSGNYGPNFERLVAMKTKYDPTNQFRMNANIKPKAKA